MLLLAACGGGGGGGGGKEDIAEQTWDCMAKNAEDPEIFEETMLRMLPAVSNLEEAQGSIPACAGEPRVGYYTRFGQEVYPRVCGGTYLFHGADGGVKGLSPRVRGNPLAVPERSPPDGSIPACAGEPHEQEEQNP